MTRALTIGLVQMRSGTDLDRNIVAMEDLVRQAAAKGAHYIQTPEMTGLLQANRQGLFGCVQPEATDPLVARASQLAAELGVILHIGSTPILLDEGRVANRAFVFGTDGTCLVRYDKMHMFDVDLDHGESWRESAVYCAGDRAKVLNTAMGGVDFNLGLGICYDLRFPELFAAQALAGAEILTTPAAFTKQTGAAHWHVLLRARAIETGSFVASAAQGGIHEDGRETYGHSLIVDPWGGIVAALDHDEPDVLVAAINLENVLHSRKKIPNLQHKRPIMTDVLRKT